MPEAGREERGLTLSTLGRYTRVNAVAVTPDGRRVVLASRDQLRLRDLESGQLLRTFEGHTGLVNAVAVTPDGRRAVSGSSDGTLRIWDLGTGQTLRTLKGHTSSVNAVAVTPDGRRAVSSSNDGTLRLWDLESGKEIATFTGEDRMCCCAVTPDARTIVAGDDSGRLHILRLVEVDKTKPAIGDTKIPLLVHKEERTKEVTPLLDENVQFTVYRPREIIPVRWYKMLIFSHLDERPEWLDTSEPSPLEEVQEEAQRILGHRLETYRKTTEESRLAIPREGEITLVPEMRGIEFNPPTRSFSWKDGLCLHLETFELRAGPDFNAPTVVRGRVTIFLGHLILAEVALSILVCQSQGSATLARTPSQWNSARRFRRIFASYSHKDLEVVEEMERHALLGDRYLRDWVDLRAGERWNERLLGMITEADIFQLFWSWNSSRSPYVEREWRHALSLKREAFIRPTYWENPWPDPPEPLRPIHFQLFVRRPERHSPKPTFDEMLCERQPGIPFPPSESPPSSVTIGSGGTTRKSPSKDVISFLAIAAVLMVGGLYLVIRLSQPPQPQPAPPAASPSQAAIATPTPAPTSSSPVGVARPSSSISLTPTPEERSRTALQAAAKDHPWVNSLGMKFVPVAGTQVLFSVWDTRVQDFETFVKSTGYDPRLGMWSLGKDGWKQRGATWKEPGFSQGPTHPVVGVSWNDAEEFCKWLTKRERISGDLPEDREYRLPTDEEWSAAVGLKNEAGSTPEEKSGKIQLYPWDIPQKRDKSWPPPSGAGNYCGEESRIGNEPKDWSVIEGYNDGYPRTSPVGSFEANFSGLHDMGGNVWQWCENWYNAQAQYRVLRGASWAFNFPDHLLASYRGQRAPDYRRNSIGFRCVVAVESSR
jgi:formylglycine-generating enzyme required for sulfatase activity